MDDHQRRIWSQMIQAVDRFGEGEVDLATLASQLRGLLVAADLHDSGVTSGFWEVFQEIDMELELRSEAWAPVNSASDERLVAGVAAFRAWSVEVLAATDTERT